MLKSHTKSVAGTKNVAQNAVKDWRHENAEITHQFVAGAKNAAQNTVKDWQLKNAEIEHQKCCGWGKKKLPKILLRMKETSIHRILYNHHAFIHAEKWAKNAAHLIRRENGVIISHKSKRKVMIFKGKMLLIRE